METCGHCGETFEEEGAYLSHLAAEHEDDLTRLERRKVEAASAGPVPDGLSDRLPSGGFLVLVAILLFSAALVALVSFGLGSGDSGAERTPTGIGEAHYHGTIDVVIEGERIDFSQQQYQLQADAFHFEGGDGTQWHVHARGVTFGWAMETLGINVTRNTVTVDGQTYRDGDPGTAVTVTVNGDSVDPDSYVLREGDTIRIVVESDP